MEKNFTPEDDIFSEEYQMSDSTKPSDIPEEDIKEDINICIDSISSQDENYSINKPWRKIIKAIIKYD